MCWIIVRSDFNVSMNCDFIKKWLKYHTCKECEDEVNRKGHLTKIQEAVHVDNIKYIIIKSEQNTILPILKHGWTKRRSLAQITGELKIIGTKSPSILFDWSLMQNCFVHTHRNSTNIMCMHIMREGILQNIMAVTWIECGKALRNPKNIECNTMCLTRKKVIFF